MKVLIIGGAGLLGSFLAPALENSGFEVALCDNFSGSIRYRVDSRYRIFSANATDKNSMRHVFSVFQPDIVFLAVSYHFSRDSIYKPQDDVSLVLRSANAITPLLKNVKHLVFCSSSEVYGGPQPRKPVRENRTIGFSSSNHGAGKLAAEIVLSYKCYELGINFTAARIFDMYGPRIYFTPKSDILNFVIDSFIRQEFIGVVGAYKQRDFIHAEDVANVMVSIIENEVTGTINIGSGKGIKLMSAISEVCKNMDVTYKPAIIPDKDPPIYSAVADTSLLKSKLNNWKPKHDLKSDIPKLIEFRRRETEYYGRNNSQQVLNASRGIND